MPSHRRVSDSVTAAGSGTSAAGESSACRTRACPDLGGGFGDDQAPSEEVDAAHPQCGHLAEAETGVGEQPDDVVVVAGGLGEVLVLVVGGEPRLVAGHPGQGDSGGGIAGDATVSHGEVEQQ